MIVALAAISSSVVTYLLKDNTGINEGAQSSVHQELSNSDSAPYCGFKILRLDGYRYIQPVQFIEQECESPKYAELKAEVNAAIDSFYRTGLATNVSYFLRDFEYGAWTSVNPEYQYHPGSLMKVPVLITYLKMSESDSKLLDKMIFNDVPANQVPQQYFETKRIVEGLHYSIRDLLKYMITHSDNTATMLLLKNINRDLYINMYEDLHLEVPDLTDFNFTMSATEYSLFLSAVFNGSYLNKRNSEYAMELLATSDFKDGIIAGVNSKIPVVHKFGEWSDGKTTSQFHEAGVLYFGDEAYMLIVMTEGSDSRKQPIIVKELTAITADFILRSGISRISKQSTESWRASNHELTAPIGSF